MKIVLRRRLKIVLKKKPVAVNLVEGIFYEDASWGIRIVTQDRPVAWVKDSKTGYAIKKENARCIGLGKDGHYYWIKQGEKLYIGDKAHPSIWKEGELP